MNTRGLKIIEDEGATFGLPTVRPLRGLDHHVEKVVLSSVGDVKTVSLISISFLN